MGEQPLVMIRKKYTVKKFKFNNLKDIWTIFRQKQQFMMTKKYKAFFSSEPVNLSYYKVFDNVTVLSVVVRGVELAKTSLVCNNQSQ